MSKSKIVILISMLATICLSISCSILNSATTEDEPIVRITNLQLSEISDTQAIIEAAIEIENPNPTPATLVAMIYEIHLGHSDDWIFLDHETEDRATIKGEQTLKFAVIESIQGQLKLDAMREMIAETDFPKIRLKGKVWVEIGVNLFEIPFEQKADIPRDITKAGEPK